VTLRLSNASDGLIGCHCGFVAVILETTIPDEDGNDGA